MEAEFVVDLEHKELEVKEDRFDIGFVRVVAEKVDM